MRDLNNCYRLSSFIDILIVKIGMPFLREGDKSLQILYL